MLRPASTALALLAAAAAVAVEAPASQPAARLRPVVGEIQTALVMPDDTLLDIAFRYGIGYEPLMRLNPGIDPWIPEPGTVVRLPTRYVHPDVEPEGLVINVPEMRLFDFTVGDGPAVLAAAVGDPEDPTLLGDFRLGQKRMNPTWFVPKSIREEKPELPARVAPGPDNPLGTRWMNIGRTSYGIHGTNVRWSIGREATHGCVRLYEDDVRRLYDRVSSGTRIQIVYQPFKWGLDGSRIYVEAHPDRYGLAPDRLAGALAVPRELGLLEAIDVEAVWRAADEARGVPVRVGRLPASASR